jgi:hypothetical protein
MSSEESSTTAHYRFNVTPPDPSSVVTLLTGGRGDETGAP